MSWTDEEELSNTDDSLTFKLKIYTQTGQRYMNIIAFLVEHIALRYIV